MLSTAPLYPSSWKEVSVFFLIYILYYARMDVSIGQRRRCPHIEGYVRRDSPQMESTRWQSTPLYECCRYRSFVRSFVRFLTVSARATSLARALFCARKLGNCFSSNLCNAVYSRTPERNRLSLCSFFFVSACFGVQDETISNRATRGWAFKLAAL